jgi:C_GCAxxG_C_C family probable redox protein
MTRQEDATIYFADGFNCSQAVFTAFGKTMGLTEDQCLKIGSAFGGGMARRQYTCGAMTGGLMVLGLYFGRGLEDDISKKEGTYEKAGEFFKEFEKRNGSVVCKDLLQGLDMNNTLDRIRIEELGLFQTSCVKYVQDAVEIVEKLIG